MPESSLANCRTFLLVSERAVTVVRKPSETSFNA